MNNSRTHATKLCSLQEFGKSINTRYLTKQIEYLDENSVTKVIDCFLQHGESKDRSKGLVKLCKELVVQLPTKVKLEEVCEILSKYRAFQNAS